MVLTVFFGEGFFFNDDYMVFGLGCRINKNGNTRVSERVYYVYNNVKFSFFHGNPSFLR